jgi:hypothetical protein
LYTVMQTQQCATWKCEGKERMYCAKLSRDLVIVFYFAFVRFSSWRIEKRCFCPSIKGGRTSVTKTSPTNGANEVVFVIICTQWGTQVHDEGLTQEPGSHYYEHALRTTPWRRPLINRMKLFPNISAVGSNPVAKLSGFNS